MFKKDDFLFDLDFDLYPDEDVSLETIKLFQEKVEGYHWALSQSGEIVRAHFKDLPSMSFIVNTRDEQTRWSLNLLPKFFSGSLRKKEKELWQIEVYFHAHRETDRIILVDDRVHLEHYYLTRQGHLATFKDLLSDVAKIRETI